MASTTASDIAAALSLLFTKPLTRAINDNNVLIHLLPHVRGEGKALNWTVELDNAAAGAAVAETTSRSASDADSEIRLNATLPWAIYDKVASATGLAEATTATSPNVASLLGPQATLIARQATNAYTKLLRGVSAHLYSGQAGQSPGQIVGIATSIDSAGSYAGIDPGTYTTWVGTENNVASASLSFAAIRENLFTPIYDASGENPVLVVCPTAKYDQIKRLFGSAAVPYIREITIPQPMRPTDVLPRPDRTVKLAAGMEAFEIDGIPFIRDRDCTSGTLYGINTRYLHLEQVPKPVGGSYAVTDDAIMRILAAGVGTAVDRLKPDALAEIRDAIMNPVGIVPYFNHLAKTGDQETVQAIAYLQLCNQNRRAHGKLVIT